MVKGVTRRVVVVRAPEPDLFEQAIFIVRSDVCDKGGVSEEDLLRQAQQAAGRYITSSVKGGRLSRFFSGQLFSLLAGGGMVGLVWLITAIVF